MAMITEQTCSTRPNVSSPSYLVGQDARITREKFLQDYILEDADGSDGGEDLSLSSFSLTRSDSHKSDDVLGSRLGDRADITEALVEELRSTTSVLNDCILALKNEKKLASSFQKLFSSLNEEIQSQSSRNNVVSDVEDSNSPSTAQHDNIAQHGKEGGGGAEQQTEKIDSACQVTDVEDVVKKIVWSVKMASIAKKERMHRRANFRNVHQQIKEITGWVEMIVRHVEDSSLSESLLLPAGELEAESQRLSGGQESRISTMDPELARGAVADVSGGGGRGGTQLVALGASGPVSWQLLFRQARFPPPVLTEVRTGWSRSRGAHEAADQRYLQDCSQRFERMRDSWRRKRERISFLEKELSSLHRFVVDEAEKHVRSWEDLLSSDLLRELQGKEHIIDNLQVSTMEKSLQDRELRLSELKEQLGQIKEHWKKEREHFELRLAAADRNAEHATKRAMLAEEALAAARERIVSLERTRPPHELNGEEEATTTLKGNFAKARAMIAVLCKFLGIYHKLVLAILASSSGGRDATAEWLSSLIEENWEELIDQLVRQAQGIEASNTSSFIHDIQGVDNKLTALQRATSAIFPRKSSRSYSIPLLDDSRHQSPASRGGSLTSSMLQRSAMSGERESWISPPRLQLYLTKSSARVQLQVVNVYNLPAEVLQESCISVEVDGWRQTPRRAEEGGGSTSFYSFTASVTSSVIRVFVVDLGMHTGKQTTGIVSLLLAHIVPAGWRTSMQERLVHRDWFPVFDPAGRAVGPAESPALLELTLSVEREGLT
eukprot:27238-Hanusia_phi.AAC.2